MATTEQCAEYVTQLAEAKTALHQLLTGTKAVSLTYANKTVTYNQISINALRLYIQQLQDNVDNCSGTRAGRRIIRFIPN